jgi:phosphoribosylformylglycinamidine synthase
VDQLRRLAEELLADPVTEEATFGVREPFADAVIEIHPLPGVMDPDAEAVEAACRAILGSGVQVRTARRYDLHGTDGPSAREVAERSLANTVVHAIHDQPYRPEAFPAGERYRFRQAPVVIEDMDDRQLAALSRDAHLFLAVDEMRAIQAEYRRLGRDPQEIELETIAQTWSEHCVHKTLKATFRYRAEADEMLAPGWAEGRPGHSVEPDGSVTIRNLFKSTIVAATDRLVSEGIDWCLSVFADNAGVVAFDDEHAVCFKVETHNHPSALEPYGGAATGVGGCIRDIMGTGLGAKPIASTDVFCVAYPDNWAPGNSAKKALPQGCLHPRRILRQVVAGVRDYGNRMGIPTLNGAVWFDDAYVGNPLVYCGCIGVMPRDRVSGAARDGDHIVVLGGRTGRDGIHGATFSSSELTGQHADEFSHAVQIGNAVTEKKLLDAILEARDKPGGALYHAITDCGAGGFSSAVGEMGSDLGAEVHLERAPLKYAGLSPTEIWISEAQERMVLAVPPEAVDALAAICRVHDVEMCDLGRFGTPDGDLVLHYQQAEVGRLSMSFLHEGRPDQVREAAWSPRRHEEASFRRSANRAKAPSIGETLLRLLAHPNLASKHWIVRQYDHEVQGATVVKPLVGTSGEGPSDGAVITPVLGSSRGLAVACGLATGLRDDPYLMTLAAIDECVRNLVCVGADPSRIALLDNFCWPGCQDAERLGELVRAAVACHDGAIAYRAPFISGKDSLNNQFTDDRGQTTEIPPTLLISGIGLVPAIDRCLTMDAKAPGNLLVLVGPPTQGLLGGSHFSWMFADGDASPVLPDTNLETGPATARAVADLVASGVVRSAHDLSDGGLLAAAAEMALAGGLGLELAWKKIPRAGAANDNPYACLFSEEPSRYLLEIEPDSEREFQGAFLGAMGKPPAAGRRRYLETSLPVSCSVIGRINDSSRVRLSDGDLDVPIEAIREAWLGTLDW